VAKKIRNIIIISLFAIIPTLLIWAPFFFRIPSIWNIPLSTNGMATVVANYDGPLYLVTAKTLYNKTAISENFQFPLPTEYYPAHFPLFPLLIRGLGFFVNYPYAMLFVTVFGSIIALYFVYRLLRKFVGTRDAMFLTFVFSMLPARFLIVRSVGSPDPLFVGAIVASLFYFRKKAYWYAAFWGVIAQATKSPGILLFVSYFLYTLLFNLRHRADWKRAYPLLLIPISLLGVFFFYKYTTGDFLAYFHSGDNIHLLFPPFQIFNYAAPWVGTFWLEEVIFVYLIGGLGIMRLWEKKEFEIAMFCTIFFLSILFVSHRDIIRYSLPIVPFLYVAFSDTLVRRDFKIVFAVIIIPILLFSLAFISQNVMPISNWGPFL
jgi:hypothetical protein